MKLIWMFLISIVTLCGLCHSGAFSRSVGFNVAKVIDSSPTVVGRVICRCLENGKPLKHWNDWRSRRSPGNGQPGDTSSFFGLFGSAVAAVGKDIAPEGIQDQAVPATRPLDNVDPIPANPSTDATGTSALASPECYLCDFDDGDCSGSPRKLKKNCKVTTKGNFRPCGNPTWPGRMEIACWREPTDGYKKSGSCKQVVINYAGRSYLSEFCVCHNTLASGIPCNASPPLALSTKTQLVVLVFLSIAFLDPF